MPRLPIKMRARLYVRRIVKACSNRVHHPSHFASASS
jgi:hypothetical protein